MLLQEINVITWKLFIHLLRYLLFYNMIFMLLLSLIFLVLLADAREHHDDLNEEKTQILYQR